MKIENPVETEDGVLLVNDSRFVSVQFKPEAIKSTITGLFSTASLV